ncbi:MAG: LLM class flavin-dependent oxidoreductase [Thermoleophilia bacterium]
MPERRLGLLFVGAPAVPEMVRLAQRAEERGLDSVWVAETRLTRDGFVPAAAIAAQTERIRIGTGIVNVYTRGPVVLAISFPLARGAGARPDPDGDRASARRLCSRRRACQARAAADLAARARGGARPLVRGER